MCVVDHISRQFRGAQRQTRKRSPKNVNGCSEIPEKICHHHIDDLAGAIQMFEELMQCIPGARADGRAAFRRLPLKPEHRRDATVVYKLGSTVMVSWHNACMFGASSSVYNWHRIGELITFIAVRWLGICLFRNVGDLFALEKAECMQDAIQCVARLVRAVLALMPQKIVGCVRHPFPVE